MQIRDGEFPDTVDALCPICIANGLAASKYQIAFNSPDFLKAACLPQAVIEEVVYRTPGYSSWQPQKWLCPSPSFTLPIRVHSRN